MAGGGGGWLGEGRVRVAGRGEGEGIWGRVGVAGGRRRVAGSKA